MRTNEAQIKLSDTVMVIDVACVNFVINDLKKYFEPILGRSLQEIDLGLLVMYLAMDAGVEEGDNEIQVLLVYDEGSKLLRHCMPSDVKGELDGVAFRGPLGEFNFLAVPSEGFVSRGDLYLDLLHIVLNAADVKRLILLPFQEEYGKEVDGALKDFAEAATSQDVGKEVVRFCMERPAVSAGSCRWEQLGYPLMSVLGIRSEELA